MAVTLGSIKTQIKALEKKHGCSAELIDSDHEDYQKVRKLLILRERLSNAQSFMRKPSRLKAQ